MASPGFTAMEDGIRAAARQAATAGEGARGLELGAVAATIGQALPGTRSATAASELSTAWEVAISTWSADVTTFSGAGCADFPNVGGQSLTLDRWTSEGNLPDARWNDAVRIVAEVTGEYGFGPPGVVVDRPSDHEITATDQYGGHYLFGTAANTVLLVSTGCHLPAKAHPGAS